MKRIFYFICVLFVTARTPALLRCVCAAQTKHHQLPDTQKKDFLESDINLAKSLNIRLTNTQTHADRFIKRLVGAQEFKKKNGQWTLSVKIDPQNCLEIRPQPIYAETETNDMIYEWQLIPQKSGYALVRATYNSDSRTEPLVQEFLVTVE